LRQLIIWDEAPMTHKYAFGSLDRSLRDIMFSSDRNSNMKPSAGKTVLLGDDFRQTLPIISQGRRQDCVSASVNRSYLWNYCQVFTLSENMRLGKTEKDFAKWILDVGNGTAIKEDSFLNEFSEVDQIIVDENLLLNVKHNSISAVEEHVYTSFEKNYANPNYLRDRGILTPRNETVDEINKVMLDWLPGNINVYASADSVSNNEYEETDFGLHI